MVANDIIAGANSYAQYGSLDSLPYNCISHLMNNDELIWKLLFYNTADAWDKSNLTQSEKASLIYNGSDDTSAFRVFMDMGQPDAVWGEQTQIRLSTYSIFPDNRTVGTISMFFECYAHYKVNHLSNYKTRTDMITQRFLQVFNGVNIAGIGRMHFDILGNPNDRREPSGQTPFKGMYIIMSNKSN